MAKYFSAKWQMFFLKKTPMDFGYDLAVSRQGSEFRVQSSEQLKKSHVRATLREIFLIPLVP
ncbi:MAG: hypothetical protein J6Q39_01620 [Bacteroidales bacterium]|nr:hypothetical protein [Bacteroidales bacterium]